MDSKANRGQILKELRIKKGLKQSDLASFLDITQQAYQRYESGTSEPNADGYTKLADFYGVTTDCLLGREPAPDPFSDLHISPETEREVIDKYMSLPENVRAAVLDMIRQLGGVVDAGSELTETASAGTLHDRLADTEAEEIAG